MDLGRVTAEALRQGGPAAGVVILFAWLKVFDLPFPGDQPTYMNLLKPILVIAGAQIAYAYWPAARRRRALVMVASVVLCLVALLAYRYFNDVPAAPSQVALHVAGAWTALVITYFIFGMVVRELIVYLSAVFAQRV